MAAAAKGAAARSETNGQPKQVEFKGQVFALPAEMPFAFALYAQEGEILKALRVLIAPDDFDRFMGTGGSMAEFVDWLTAVQEVYGIDEGGSAASSSS